MSLCPSAHALTLGYSPCPNDTFIFYALAHRKIDTFGMTFNEVLLDVETLNRKAMNSELDVTKVSFYAYGCLRDHYSLLSSGGALGRGCGPLIVAKTKTPANDLRGKRIAIPGRLTTANLLLHLYDPALAEDTVVMPFDSIMDSVRRGEVEAGLIIHESRFTYPAYGLFEMIDLGRWWEAETGLPIPLGCIIARKGLGGETIRRVDSLIRESVAYALSHRTETVEYVKAHARELEDKVIEQHINLYVNEHSLDLGEDGVQAVEELMRRAEKAGLLRGVATSEGGKDALVR